jgi:cellulose 1,4-beta-cellobiosidase
MTTGQVRHQRSPFLEESMKKSISVAVAVGTMLTGSIAIATVSAAGVARASITTTTAPENDSRLDNPFIGGNGYVNPEWKAKAESVAGGSRVSNTPTAVWIDRIAAIEGSADGGPDGRMGMQDHLDAALAQGASYIQFVLYDLPQRDCLAPASDGEWGLNDLPRYKSEFVDAIAAIQSDPRYRNLRIVNVIEPRSLTNLIYSPTVITCAQVMQSKLYVDGLAYALGKLHAAGPNVYNYLDAADHGSLGWETNLGRTVDLFGVTVRQAQGGYATVDGFVTNTANYAATVEPYLGDINRQFDGVAFRSATWIDWNSFYDEQSFAQAYRAKLISVGFPSSIGMLIDTGRNGWGGPDRPAGPSTSNDLNAFVNESRTDRRIHAGNTCNQAGAGLGRRPTPAPAPGIDAYVWVKPPGESDGTSMFSWDGLDRMCDPTYGGNSRNSNNPTGALPGAPNYGVWFPAQFAELMANAYPPLDAGTTSTTTTTTTRPTTTTATTTTTTTTTRPTTTTTRSEGTTTSTTTRTTTTQPTTTTATTTRGGKGCTATYAVLGQWPGGFQGDVKVTAGSSAISGWKLTWTFSSGQTVQQSWGSTISSSGPAVTAANAAWNGALGAGASTSFGFIGSWNGTNSAPSLSCVAG